MPKIRKKGKSDGTINSQGYKKRGNAILQRKGGTRRSHVVLGGCKGSWSVLGNRGSRVIRTRNRGSYEGEEKALKMGSLVRKLGTEKQGPKKGGRDLWERAACSRS